MATETFLSIFMDFNAPTDETVVAPIEAEPAQPDQLGLMREEAWTEGYLTGRHEVAISREERGLAATLLTSIHALEASASEAVDAASLILAELMVETMIAVTSEAWPTRLLSRVRTVAERIKPVLTTAPEYLLRDASGAERRFDSLTELSRALDDGIVGEDVTIRWPRGEATISRTALLEDLRDAVLPLSAGLVNEQNARQQS